MRAKNNAAIGAAALLGLLAGTAHAQNVQVEANLSADAAASLASRFGDAGLAGDGINSSLWRSFSATGQNTGSGLTTGSLRFGFSSGSSIGTFNSDDGKRFYLDAASGLGDNWFDSNSGLVRPSNSTPTLAFGQSGSGAFSSNSIVISFAPGVAAFGFNFNDLDRGGNLLVTFNNGAVANVDLTSGDQFSGFISIIADSGTFINSVELQQGNISANDGLSLYDFTTMAIVPLPPAAWAGLAVLGGIAGARKLRRR